MPNDDSRLTFGDYSLDTYTGKVSGPGGDVLLRPKAYALLTHLALNPGRVVPKGELLDAVWPNIFVQEGSLTQAVKELRKALGEGASLLRTVAGRGYLLVGEVPSQLVADHREPVVAVLRFRNDNESETDSVLIDGFAEDIVSGLARSGTLMAIAGRSSFQFQSYAAQDAGQKLGADFLIEGAISRRGDNAVVTVGLSDARSHVRLWGERYDAQGLDIFAVQREIAWQVVDRLVRRLGEATITRTNAVAPNDLPAYDLVIRAAALLDQYGVEASTTAIAHLETAISRDPGYARAHAYYALALAMRGGLGLASPDVLAVARERADTAVRLAPDNAVTYRMLATIQLYQRQHDAAEASLRTSIELNPSDADTVGLMGHLLVLRGWPLDGQAWLDRAAKLNPVHQQWYDFSRALAAYQLGEYQESLGYLRQLPDTVPHISDLTAAAAAMAKGGNPPEDDIDPISNVGFSGDILGWEHLSELEHIRDGQRRAQQAKLP
ncbi:MAG: winged helix-turn-helix domain-containing protein [Devosia sp.]